VFAVAVAVGEEKDMEEQGEEEKKKKRSLWQGIPD
jgi:hypothetical protein